MLSLRLAGSFLFRLADRQFLPLLFHEPPRNTRLAPAMITLRAPTLGTLRHYNARGEVAVVACASPGCRHAR